MRRLYWPIVIAMAVVLLMVIYSMMPANAAEEGDIGCVYGVQLEWDGVNPYIVSYDSVDEGVVFDVVGYFLNMRFSHPVEDTYDNRVSHDLTGLTGGDFCTDYIAEGIIPEGPGTAKTARKGNVFITVSTIHPHGTIVDTWVTDNGFVLL